MTFPINKAAKKFGINTKKLADSLDLLVEKGLVIKERANTESGFCWYLRNADVSFLAYCPIKNIFAAHCPDIKIKNKIEANRSKKGYAHIGPEITVEGCKNKNCELYLLSFLKLVTDPDYQKA